MAKTKFQIKNRYTGEIIVEMEAETLKEVVEKNKVILRGADLWGANLRGANLRGADLQEANLRGVDLQGADLREANLWGANFWGADLQKVNLQGANLRGTDLWGAKIKITQKEDLIKSLGIIVENEK